VHCHWHVLLTPLLTDDDGQDLVEYALLSGIVGLGGWVLMPTIADAMKAAYTNWQNSAQAVWEPCPPAPGACP
jgi:Flp pilus assembly pilin Flp